MFIIQNANSNRGKINKIKKRILAPVKTSCFCRVELNSGVMFAKSRAETRRLNQTFKSSSTSSAVIHESGTAAIRTLCFGCTKHNSEINVFWWDCVFTRNSEENYCLVSVNPESVSILVGRLNQRCVSAVL